MLTSTLALLLVAQSPEVRVPLDVFTAREAELAALRQERDRHHRAAPPTVGETIYSGRSDGRNLRFTLRLVAQIGADRLHSQIPVLGRDAVIVSARSNGAPVALVADGPNWVLPTKAHGRVELVVEFLVPPRGPRGSIEYRFGIVESPVTEVTIDFDTPELLPQIAGAVTREVTAKNGGTSLSAVLRPSSEIHVVGLHDVASTDGRPAKVYGRTHSLVSLSDESIELFAVLDFTILYAPRKQFHVTIPAGYEVVSADGQGAFHYTIGTQDHQPVLVGETAFGMRDHYEISIRLKRTLGADEAKVELPVLRLHDVERDTGYVALEIPGKLSIEGVEGDGLVPLDVRELPETIVASAVSPVVRAFRYADRRGPVSIDIARYPERALATGGVDELRATSVVTSDGRVMTDARFELRNVLEQYLAVALHEGAQVESAAIDGRPVKPSRDEDGRVLLPLVRSTRSGGQLVPFEVQLVYRFDVPELGLVGRRGLSLPRLDVPVSSLEWNVYVPGGYETTSLAGPVNPQRFVQHAQWHEAGLATASAAFGPDYDAPRPATDAGGGAMAVQVRLPKRGRHLVYRRYWIDPGQSTTVRFGFVRASIDLLWSILATLLLAALAYAAIRSLRTRARLAPLAFALGAIAVVLFADPSMVGAAFLTAAVLALEAKELRRRFDDARVAVIESTRGVFERGRQTLESKRARFEQRREERLVVAWAGELVSVSWLVFRLMLLMGVGMWFLSRVVALLDLLGRPI